jgi:PKD repeat protein
MKKLIYLSLMAFIAISCSKKPIADFSYPTITKVGEDIQFTNLSSNAEQFSWSFGDGNSSTESEPLHSYEKPGAYTVTLTAIGNGESVSTSKTLNITGTTYSFKNESSYDLPSFCSYYWDGNDILDFILHGTLYKNSETEVVITERPTISFGFQIGDDVAISEDYSLTSNMHNQLIINDQTPIYTGKSEDKQELLEKVKQALQ